MSAPPGSLGSRSTVRLPDVLRVRPVIGNVPLTVAGTGTETAAALWTDAANVFPRTFPPAMS